MTDQTTPGSPEGLARLHAGMRACRRCPEAGYPITPGAVFSGPGTARVMVVGQAPGATESDTGCPFSGPSGRRLFRWLAAAGWDEEVFRATQYLTAITKCYPGRARSGKGDRPPGRGEQDLCAPFLEGELVAVAPHVIVPVGALSVRRFLGAARLADVVGTAVLDGGGRWIVPLPHPSGASLWLNRPQNRLQVDEALAHLRRLSL